MATQSTRPSKVSATLGKRQSLLRLAKERRTPLPGYKNLADYHGGAYECDWVSPYTKGACNVDADIFVLLQDWASDELLRGKRNGEIEQLGRLPSLPTNKNLEELLEDTFNLQLHDVFATNLFPYIKPRGMSSAIPPAVLVDAARRFAVPQIRIVQPKVVICLGKTTFNALRRALGSKPLPTLAEAIGSPFKFEEAEIWCQAHPGARGLMTRGGIAGARRDWQKMRTALQRPAGQVPV